DYVRRGAGGVVRAVTPIVAAALRAWDRRTAAGVHRFVAISRHVADRIRRSYGREADVIHPPVDTQRYQPGDGEVGDYYLVVSALSPYKRIDLALAAAGRLGRRLLVVGTGPEASRLRRLAGPTVEFLGWRDDEEVASLYRRCRALLFPGLEDFGIVPLEAMAAGRPVIAYGVGGVLDTVVPPGGGEPPTGVLFHDQTVEALVAAMLRYEAEADRFSPKALRAHAETFDRRLFKDRIAAYLDACLAGAVRC
ncbi:MAG: glycosyltransferase, partial [Candidatus Rokuibacteriota bacterium]